MQACCEVGGWVIWIGALGVPHEAQKQETIPSAVVKSPAVRRLPVGVVARPWMRPLVPAPMGDQAAPFHRAMLLAGAPPAKEKAKNEPLEPWG